MYSDGRHIIFFKTFDCGRNASHSILLRLCFACTTVNMERGKELISSVVLSEDGVAYSMEKERESACSKTDL